jgi:radical SAM superfamily enzyme YgiQ (UPF0313 family)
LGTILKQEGYDVRIYIEDIAPIEYSEVMKSDIVGISSLTATAPRAYRLAKLFKEHGKKVILGGPHVSFLPEEALEYADYVVRGEGELVIKELLSHLNGSKDIKEISGISYKENNKIIHNQGRKVVENLDELPVPDLSLIVGWEKLFRKERVYPIITSRGCPYDCSFCSVTAMFGRRYRFRSIENVMDELMKVPRNSLVFFYDDNFTANVNRTKELLKEIIRKKLKIIWSAQVRVEVAEDKEMLELMKESGCVTVFIGFESINPDTLLEYNKRQTLQQIKKCIFTLRRFGIRIHGMFVIGADSDDRKTVRETMKFVSSTKIDTIQICALTPLPGTKLFHQLLNENRLPKTNHWEHHDGLHVVHTPKKISKYELQFEIIKALVNFYSWWRSLWYFVKLDFINAIIRWKGYRIAQKWLRSNIEYLKKLKEEWKKKKLLHDKK